MSEQYIDSTMHGATIKANNYIYLTATCFGQKSTIITPVYTIFENKVKNAMPIT